MKTFVENVPDLLNKRRERATRAGAENVLYLRLLWPKTQTLNVRFLFSSAKGTVLTLLSLRYRRLTKQIEFNITSLRRQFTRRERPKYVDCPP